MKNFYKLLVSNILFFMILIVIAIILSGCGQKEYCIANCENYVEKDLSSGPPNYGAIADVLGCMFAPSSEECEELRKQSKEQPVFED